MAEKIHVAPVESLSPGPPTATIAALSERLTENPVPPKRIKMKLTENRCDKF